MSASSSSRGSSTTQPDATRDARKFHSTGITPQLDTPKFRSSVLQSSTVAALPHVSPSYASAKRIPTPGSRVLFHLTAAETAPSLPLKPSSRSPMEPDVRLKSDHYPPLLYSLVLNNCITNWSDFLAYRCSSRHARDACNAQPLPPIIFDQLRACENRILTLIQTHGLTHTLFEPLRELILLSPLAPHLNELIIISNDLAHSNDERTKDNVRLRILSFLRRLGRCSPFRHSDDATITSSIEECSMHMRLLLAPDNALLAAHPDRASIRNMVQTLLDHLHRTGIAYRKNGIFQAQLEQVGRDIEAARVLRTKVGEWAVESFLAEVMEVERMSEVQFVEYRGLMRNGINLEVELGVFWWVWAYDDCVGGPDMKRRGAVQIEVTEVQARRMPEGDNE